LAPSKSGAKLAAGLVVCQEIDQQAVSVNIGWEKFWKGKKERLKDATQFNETHEIRMARAGQNPAEACERGSRKKKKIVKGKAQKAWP